MQQVMDYFDLLTDQETSHVVWNLTFASTNSPFTAEGTPVDLRTNAPAYGLVASYVARIDRGLIRLAQGEPLESDFPAEKKPTAERMLKRNLNGIGRTRVTVADDDVPVEIAPANARRSLEVMQGIGDALYDSLFGTFARREVGAIEGRIVDLGTDYEEPAVKLKEHRSGREIQCRISKAARDEIESMLTAGDVWQHRRVRVRGILNYDPTGKLVRVYDGRISYIDPPTTSVSELHDPSFTGGLPAYEYLERLREGALE
jgi:hypothetical protein